MNMPLDYGFGAQQEAARYSANERRTPARADIAAKDKAISIDSVMNSQYEHCDIDFIFHSFYLPVQVLKSPLYRIEPIQVIEGEDFRSVINNGAPGELIVWEGCCLRMLENARQVGISRRHILSSGQRIAVCKIWYGRI